MALQFGALREALLEAGASVGSAGRAAEGAAGYENRLATVDLGIVGVNARMTSVEARMTSVETRIGMLTTMISLLTAVVSINIALSAGVLWRILTH